jgi:hypothetical protein
VCLRALRAEDIDDFVAYRSDPEVARYQGWPLLAAARAALWPVRQAAGCARRPLLAAAGARVMVFDASAAQLAQDRFVAKRERLPLRLVQGDMAGLSRFDAGSFDLVFHPVANCFAQ